jgi:hypothetical protein
VAALGGWGVKKIQNGSRCNGQRQPFFKNQPLFKLKAQLHMAYDIPTTFARFHKV